MSTNLTKKYDAILIDFEKAHFQPAGDLNVLRADSEALVTFL